ncbi:MAG TPA: hypothetical protein VMU37_05920, partial [Caulobacteraceae bacterium]|nr:hypothetical protein [Caulobacteraceae bacterium]
WIVAVAALALLGGCVKMDKNPPKNLPDYVKLYPGAQPMMTMNLGVMSSEVETTSDNPDAVMAFYRNQAAEDGLTEKQATAPANATAGQQQAQFADATGTKILIVIAKPQNGGTLVSLSYRPVKAAS